jgi:hypothetical protein
MYSEGESTTFKENSVVCQCQCCTKLQLDISEAASELKSAKEIITIQLEELKSQTVGTYFLRCTERINDKLNASTCHKNLDGISAQVSYAATTWKQVPLDH